MRCPPRGMLTDDLRERFARYLEPADGGCLLWTGNTGRAFSIGIANYDARAFAWAMDGREPFDEGLSLAPTCGHERCVAPAHLAQVPGRKRARIAADYAPSGYTPTAASVQAPSAALAIAELEQLAAPSPEPPPATLPPDRELLDYLDRSITTISVWPHAAIVYARDVAGYGRNLREAAANALAKSRGGAR